MSTVVQAALFNHVWPGMNPEGNLGLEMGQSRHSIAIHVPMTICQRHDASNLINIRSLP